jgi:hypothetical protein
MLVPISVILTPTNFAQTIALPLSQLNMSQIRSLFIDNSANVLPVNITAGAGGVSLTVQALGGGVFPVFSDKGGTFTIQIQTATAPSSAVKINFQLMNFVSAPADWGPVSSVQIGNASIAVTQGGGPWSISGSVTQSGGWNVGQSGVWTVASTQSGVWTMAATQSGNWTISVTSSPGSPINISGPVSQQGGWNVGQSGNWTVNSTQNGTWNINSVQSGSWSISVNNTGAAPVNISGPVSQAGTWNINSVQSGTWNIGQSGTWNVNAIQSGTWNVAGNMNANITNANIIIQGQQGRGQQLEITPTVVGAISNSSRFVAPAYPTISTIVPSGSAQLIRVRASGTNASSTFVHIFSGAAWQFIDELPPGGTCTFGDSGGPILHQTLGVSSVNGTELVTIAIWNY